MSTRRRDIDWMRGIAVLCMIEHHTFDAFLRPSLHGTAWDRAFRFLGGVAAPGFLFLAGLSVVLMLERSERRGVPRGEACAAAVRRAGLVVFGAYVFRLQEWALAGGTGPWQEMLRIDVLNCIGVALGLVALAWALAASGRGRAVALGAGALAFGFGAPLVWAAPLAGVPAYAVAYLRGQPPLALFPLFPWVAHAFAGALVGLVVARTAAEREPRLFAALAAGAVAVWFATRALDALPGLPRFPGQRWWDTSPAYFVLRTCSSIWMLAALFALDRGLRALRPAGPPDLLLTLGRHSLVLYWVHVEIVYGRWFWRARGTLDLAHGALAVAILFAAMGALACLVEPAKTLWRSRRAPVLAGAP